MNAKSPFTEIIITIFVLTYSTVYSQIGRNKNLSQIYNNVHRTILKSKPGQMTTILVARNGTSRVNQVDLTEQVSLIVEFKGEPMFLQQLHSPSQTLQSSVYQLRHSQFRSDLDALHQTASKSLKVQLVSPVITREFSKVFYGAAVKVPRGMVSQIARLSYVKKIHIDAPVKALLEQSVHQIRADSVWTKFGTQGDSVIVGIIDTGIDYADSALGGGFGPGYKVIGGYDFVNNDADPMDDNGHGTHVAGIVAANGDSLKGVAPHAKLMAFKVLNENGSGTESEVIAGIERATDPNNVGNSSDKVDIVNMSLGGSGDPDDALSTAVDNAVKLGITFCIAAGNSGQTGFYTIDSPGTARLAITVGAVDSSDDLAYFSSEGPDSTNYFIKPDVVAPGVSITSTYLNNTTATLSGTSMATPFVTGVCALLKSLHRNWTPATIKSAVMTTAVNIGQEVMVQGAGRIDALNAAEVTAFAYPCELSFGLDSSSFSEWIIVDTMWVANLDSVNQSFAFSLNNLPSGVSLSANPSAFSLASDDSQMVIITLGVNNSVVPYPSQGSCAYSGNVYLNGSKDMLHIPWAFVKMARVLITFNQPNASFALFNAKVGFSNATAKWIDLYDAQLLLPKGDYDMVTLFQEGNGYRYVIKEQMPIDSTSDISVRSTDATNSVIFNGVDVNGKPLNSYFLTTQSLALNYPDSSYFSGTLLFPPAPDTIYCSDFSSRFWFTCAQFANDESNIFDVQFDSLAGLDGNVSLTNLPADFYLENVHANFPLYSGGEYREMNCLDCVTYVIPSIFGFGIGYLFPLSDGFRGDWSGKLYLTKGDNERFSSGISFSAVDGPESSSSYGEYIWFETAIASAFHDSVGYSWWGNPPASDLWPIAGLTTFGLAPFYPSIQSLNNLNGKSNIYMTTGFFGAFNEALDRSTDSSMYTIYDSHNNVIASGREPNFPTTGINVTPGQFTYQLVTHDYLIRGVKGTATLVCKFDLGNSDPNPPRVPLIQLLNSKNVCTDSLSKDEKGTLVLSFNRFVSFLDLVDSSIGVGSDSVPLPDDSIKLSYRVDGNSNWNSIPVTRVQDDTTTGLSYIADVTPTSQFDSTGIDLKIDVEDQTGNTSEWVMEPAYCVGRFGKLTAVGNGTNDNSVPKSFALYQNYPNPFNPSTTIKYDLPKASKVSLVIFNILGQRVATLVNEMQLAGHHVVSWDGGTQNGAAASGVYFLHFQSEEYVKTMKMLLLK